MSTLLQADALHTHYGDSHVLRGVDLSLAGGTALGLLGRNGMGKTTLIRTLMGYVRPTAGRVQWQGQDVTGQPPERMARRGIGYVPEGRGIFPNLSVRENLAMCARPGPDGRRDWTFDRVMLTFPRLGERLSHGGQQLSGGEQQMLAIGRALMTNPLLLVLDEATEGLAPLIVDRNVRAVLNHTDHAMVLEKGQVVLQGESDALARDTDALTRLLGV